MAQCRQHDLIRRTGALGHRCSLQCVLQLVNGEASSLVFESTQQLDDAVRHAVLVCLERTENAHPLLARALVHPLEVCRCHRLRFNLEINNHRGDNL